MEQWIHFKQYSNTPSLQRLNRSAFAHSQTQGAHDALKIVVAIIFDLDPTALVAVMDPHVRAKFLLQSILQIFDRRRRGSCLASTAFSAAAAEPKLAGDQSLRPTHCRAASQNRFGNVQLVRRSFQTEEDFGVTD